MRKKIILAAFFFQITCLTHVLSASANAPNESEFCSKNIERISEKKAGKYRIRISYAHDRMCQRLEIIKQDITVFHEEGIGHHYVQEKKWSGKGNRWFITNWTGGMHCCTTLLIFELDEKFRKVNNLYVGNFDPEIIDLDHDGTPEIQITDDFLAYRFSSFAFSAKGTVILKYSNGEYILTEEMMKRAPPTDSTFKKRIPGWKKAFLRPDSNWPPESFIQTLTDIVFTGNADKALGFVNQVWPSEVAGKEDFLKSYKNALSESQYYSKAAIHFSVR